MSDWWAWPVALGSVVLALAFSLVVGLGISALIEGYYERRNASRRLGGRRCPW